MAAAFPVGEVIERGEIDNLQENMRILDVPGDGNCLFRSLEKALEFSDKEYSLLQLREIIGKYINQIK